MHAKKRNRTTSYDRHILNLIDQYLEETGAKDLDIETFVAWAEMKGEFRMSMRRVRRQFAREVSRAMSKDIFENEKGEPVRRRHSFTTPTQKTFWKVLDDMTPDEMRVSYQITRRRVGGEVFQKQRAIDFYNKHFNPGDPIETSWNYDADRKERELPTKYPDSPPEDE